MTTAIHSRCDRVGLARRQQVSPDMVPAAAAAAHTMHSHASRPTGRRASYHVFLDKGLSRPLYPQSKYIQPNFTRVLDSKV